MIFFYKFFSGELFSKIIMLLALAVVSRILTVSEFGVLSFIQLLFYYGTIIVDQGFNQILIRELARGKDSILKQLLKIIYKKYIVAFTFFTALVILIFLYDKHYIETYICYLLTLLIYPLNLNWVFIGKGKPFSSSIINIVQTSVFIFLILLFYLYYGQSSIFYFSLSFLLSYAILGMIYIIFFRKILFEFSSLFELSEVIPNMSKDIRYNFLSIILVQIYVSSNTALLYFLDSPNSVGIYNAAYRIINIITSVISIGNVFFLPVVSSFLINEDREENRFNIFLSICLVLSSFIAIGGVFNSKSVMTFLFGENFEDSSIVFSILIIGSIFVIWNVVGGTILQASGNQKQILKITSVVAVLNLIMNLILIPISSYKGAAISTLIAEIFVFSAYFIFVISRLNLKIYLNWRKWLFILLILGLLQVAIYWSNIKFVFTLLIYGLIFVVLNYFVKDGSLIRLKKGNEDYNELGKVKLFENI